MLRFAMCNEAFGTTSIAETCRILKQSGFEGIEIAPFTLNESPCDLSPTQRREISTTITDEGLEFAGLHWLMVSPQGLHLTTVDAALRVRSWQHIEELIDLAADLATGPTIMVLGSPKQRATSPGVNAALATRHLIDGLRAAVPHALERNVTLLIEALPANQCDIVTSLAAAHAVVAEIGSPAIQSMFDTHNAVDETEPHPQLIEKYFPMLRHIHINELDGRYPGAGDYNFSGIFSTLESLHYHRWVSVEVFDFDPNATTIAVKSIKFLKGTA